MKTFGFASFFAVCLSGFLASLMSLWNWIENPGSIFHDSSGTNWSFVWDTFFSWFWPMLLFFLPVFLIAGYLIRYFSKNNFS
ncbi:MAG: hypothetical protein AAFP70_11530 [Calditrichota bacterium]